MTLAKRAQQFQQTLQDRGHDFQVIELPASTRTADDAASALGCAKEQIVKSLVFRATLANDPVLVLASGPNRVNERALERLLQVEIVKADAAFVKAVTGYAIGGLPPFGHLQPLTTVVDEDLLQYSTTWAAAGTPNAVFQIKGPITAVLPPHAVSSIA
ncbi:YbaK/EbsC family protein [Rhodococcus sp. NPDC080181]|uniref:YbaK/EbsC family protein n=1 Tax=Rhodococcus sp. NPDC080181 TaxID=3155292 RepID=UPI003450F02D